MVHFVIQWDLPGSKSQPDNLRQQGEKRLAADDAFAPGRDRNSQLPQPAGSHTPSRDYHRFRIVG